MDEVTTVKVSVGEFTIRNKIKIGQEIDIAVKRATLSNGMYGQMMESPNMAELISGWRLFRLCELDSRIEKSPDGWAGCSELTKEELDELWEGWTEKSGMFPSKPGLIGTDGRAGANQDGSVEDSEKPLSETVVPEEVQPPPN